MDLREAVARLAWFAGHAAATLGAEPALAPVAHPPGKARLEGRVSVRQTPSAGARMVHLILNPFSIALNRS